MQPSRHLRFHITQPLHPHPSLSNKAFRAMSQKTWPGLTQFRSPRRTGQNCRERFSQKYALLHPADWRGSFLNQFFPFPPDKAISKVEKQNPSNVAIMFFEMACINFVSGLSQSIIYIKKYDHVSGWSGLLTRQTSPTKLVFTWSFFFSSSTCRSCSEVSTISIRCMSLISKRWDSRNWSLAFCHVCFNWLCCCRSCSKRWHTV